MTPAAGSVVLYAGAYNTTLPAAGVTVSDASDGVVYLYSGIDSAATGTETLTLPGTLSNIATGNNASLGGAIGVGWGAGVSSPGSATNSPDALDYICEAIDFQPSGAPAVSFVTSATTSNTSVTSASWAVNAPASIASGNLLVLAVEHPPTGNGGLTPTGPIGWTAHPSSPVLGGTGAALYVWYKTATSADVGASTFTVTFSGTNSAVSAAGAIVQYSGVNKVQPVGSSATATGGGISSKAVAAPTALNSGGLSLMIGGAGPDTAQTSYSITMPGTSRVASFYANETDNFGSALAISDSATTASGNMTTSVAGELAEITILLNATGSVTQTFTSSSTWTCPTGVRSVDVKAWGGGGAGGQRTTSGGGGGGGGGEFAEEPTLVVTPGNSYTVTVGTGGTTGSSPVNGGSSTFPGDSVTVTAHGGTSTAANTTTGSAGGTGSTNTTHFNGGAGANAPSGTSGGGGGSSAGTASVGNAGSSNTGGSAPTGGGAGGAGATSVGNGTAGSAPGGAGGGAMRTNSGTRTGGAGAAGQVVVTFTDAAFGTGGLDLRNGRYLAFDGNFGTSIDTGVGHTFGTLSSAYPSPYTTNAPDHKLDFVQSSRLAATGTSDSPQLTITSAYDATNTVTPPTMGTLHCWDTGLITTNNDTSTGGNGFMAQAGDVLLCRVQLPTWGGAWPAFWTWNTSGGTNNNEVDVFEYHPDNPNLLELSNHVASTNFFYTDATIVSPGNWMWIGCVAGASSCRWYVGSSPTYMYLAYDDATGVGSTWTAGLILNVSITDGFFHPAPTGTGSNTTNFSHMQVWRASPEPTNLNTAVKRASLY